MKFVQTDYDWSDFGKGLSRARRKRYQKMVEMILDGLVPILKSHADGHAINAMVPYGLFAVGIAGDSRRYSQIVTLTYDDFPGYDHLQKISTAITNSLPIGRVIYNLTMKVICVGEVQVLVGRFRPTA